LSPSRAKAEFVPATAGLQSAEESARAQSKCAGNCDIAVMVTTGYPAQVPDRRRRPPRVTCLRPLPPIGDAAGPREASPPGAGSVCIDRRAQAVLPTVMAPSIANDFRHHSEEVPMCARAWVTSYPARAAGSANTSPIRRRTMGARSTEAATVRPSTSVKPPVMKPTTMAANGPVPV
jgi:hypothetical protein